MTALSFSLRFPVVLEKSAYSVAHRPPQLHLPTLLSKVGTVHLTRYPSPFPAPFPPPAWGAGLRRPWPSGPCGPRQTLDLISLTGGCSPAWHSLQTPSGPPWSPSTCSPAPQSTCPHAQPFSLPSHLQGLEKLQKVSQAVHWLWGPGSPPQAACGTTQAQRSWVGAQRQTPPPHPAPPLPAVPGRGRRGSRRAPPCFGPPLRSLLKSTNPLLGFSSRLHKPRSYERTKSAASHHPLASTARPRWLCVLALTGCAGSSL